MNNLEKKLENLPKAKLSFKADLKIKFKLYNYLVRNKITKISEAFSLGYLGKTIAISMVLLLLTGVTSVFAYSSDTVTRGSLLYPLKRNLEKAELSLNANSKAKADINAKLALRRLSEVKHLTEDKKDNKTDKYIHETMNDALNEISLSDNQLEKINNESQLNSVLITNQKQLHTLEKIAANVGMDSDDETVDDVALAFNKVRQQKDKVESINYNSTSTEKRLIKPIVKPEKVKATTTEQANQSLDAIKAQMIDYKKKLQSDDLPKEKVDKLMDRLNNKINQAEKSLQEGNLRKFEGLMQATNALKNNGEHFLKQQSKIKQKKLENRDRIERLKNEEVKGVKYLNEKNKTEEKKSDKN